MRLLLTDHSCIILPLQRRSQNNGAAASDNSRMTSMRGPIRMTDVTAALQRFKDKRTSSSNSITSVTSGMTSVLTPPVPTTPVDGESGCTSLPSTSSQKEKVARGVRFADECGGHLVTGVCTTTDWWNELVFGVYKCPECGHTPAEDGGSMTVEVENGTQQEELGCKQCGAFIQRDAPGELFHFIQELSRGVEATLEIPGFMWKRRRPVVLYTEDNGESICWIDIGTITGAAYRLPCSALLEVTDKTSVEQRTEHAIEASQSIQNASGRRDKVQHGRMAVTPQSRSKFSLQCRALSFKGRKKKQSPRVNEGNFHMRLRWRLRPTFPVRKVTITDVRCSNTQLFVQGMLRLLDHNVDLSGSVC